ncbi:MAG: hypothetical protein WCC90_21935 [Methylocella sp.]
MTMQEASTPLIGPFAEWEIELADSAHVGLDRKGIFALCLDFHGFCQAADGHPRKIRKSVPK